MMKWVMNMNEEERGEHWRDIITRTSRRNTLYYYSESMFIWWSRGTYLAVTWPDFFWHGQRVTKDASCAHDTFPYLWHFTMEWSRLKGWGRAQRNLFLVFRIDVLLNARRRSGPRSAVSSCSLFHGSDPVGGFLHLAKPAHRVAVPFGDGLAVKWLWGSEEFLRLAAIRSNLSRDRELFLARDKAPDQIHIKPRLEILVRNQPSCWLLQFMSTSMAAIQNINQS